MKILSHNLSAPPKEKKGRLGLNNDTYETADAQKRSPATEDPPWNGQTKQGGGDGGGGGGLRLVLLTQNLDLSILRQLQITYTGVLYLVCETSKRNTYNQ